MSIKCYLEGQKAWKCNTGSWYIVTTAVEKIKIIKNT